MPKSRTNSLSGPAKLASITVASQHCVHNHQKVHQKGLFMHQMLQKSLFFGSTPAPVFHRRSEEMQGDESAISCRFLLLQILWLN